MRISIVHYPNPISFFSGRLGFYLDIETGDLYNVVKGEDGMVLHNLTRGVGYSSKKPGDLKRSEKTDMDFDWRSLDLEPLNPNITIAGLKKRRGWLGGLERLAS